MSEIYECCWNPKCDGTEGNPHHCQPPLPTAADAKVFNDQLDEGGDPLPAPRPLPGTPKLTPDQVRQIIELRADQPFARFPAGHEKNLQTMADRFGVTKACISRICHGYGWRELRKAETAHEASGLPDKAQEDDAC